MIRIFSHVLVMFAAIVVGLTVIYTIRRNNSVVLPNGFVGVHRYFPGFVWRDDLLAADGKTVLSRGTEFICFNDRFVYVAPAGGRGGLFDARTRSHIPREQRPEIYEPDGLMRRGHGCNGYYTGMIGISLLFEENEAPFLPPCSWRNLDNPRLKDKSWFDRPCAEGTRTVRNPGRG